MIEIIDFMKAHEVKSVLDVGANVGHFSSILKHYIPEMDIFMIEGNPFCDMPLKNTNLPYEICCLSDTEKFIKMFINKNNNVCTGSSYYKETTKHYDDADYVNVNTQLLDNVIQKKFRKQKAFDYIKLDTQGSEIDIMKGGPETTRQARYIQVELSLIEYNKGAPLKDEVIHFMNSIGFVPKVLVEKHYWEQDPSKELIQEDWIFTK